MSDHFVCAEKFRETIGFKAQQIIDLAIRTNDISSLRDDLNEMIEIYTRRLRRKGIETTNDTAWCETVNAIMASVPVTLATTSTAASLAPSLGSDLVSAEKIRETIGFKAQQITDEAIRTNDISNLRDDLNEMIGTYTRWLSRKGIETTNDTAWCEAVNAIMASVPVTLATTPTAASLAPNLGSDQAAPNHNASPKRKRPRSGRHGRRSRL